MLDHPVQFFLSLVLLCGLLGWRIRARLLRRRLQLRFPAWRWFLQGLAEFLTLCILLLVMVDGTRFVGINFCVDLWAEHNWCNHPADGPTGAD